MYFTNFAALERPPCYYIRTIRNVTSMILACSRLRCTTILHRLVWDLNKTFSDQPMHCSVHVIFCLEWWTWTWTVAITQTALHVVRAKVSKPLNSPHDPELPLWIYHSGHSIPLQSSTHDKVGASYVEWNRTLTWSDLSSSSEDGVKWPERQTRAEADVLQWTLNLMK